MGLGEVKLMAWAYLPLCAWPEASELSYEGNPGYYTSGTTAVTTGKR